MKESFERITVFDMKEKSDSDNRYQAHSGQRECVRCGNCCKSGGPAFHLQDRAIVEKKKIELQHLFTIREGEPVHENVRNKVSFATSDIIKIKGRDNTWSCLFFDEDRHQCLIYENRPAECRALKCWDTTDIENIYAIDYLTRKDLLQSVRGLWDLVKEHQQRCAYMPIYSLIKDTEQSKTRKKVSELNQIIAYDNQIRNLTVEKAGISPGITDFLFGRPLVVTLKPVMQNKRIIVS